MPLFPLDAVYAAWRDQIATSRQQMQRLSPVQRRDDPWGTRVRSFSPGERTPEGFEQLVTLIGAESSVLDIGAGGGRFSVPLAAEIRHVTAVDGSDGMTAGLRDQAEAIANLDVLDPDFWPPSDVSTVPTVDVTFNSHVVYFVEDIGAFLDAMERHATRLCVVIAGDRPGGAPPLGAFEAAHQEQRIEAPAAHELMTVLAARGAHYRVEHLEASDALPGGGDPFSQLRSRIGVEEGSDEEERLRAWFDREAQHDSGMRSLALISWPPLVE